VPQSKSRPRVPDKRQRILAAALEVCRLRGVAAARMDEVASRAGVSKGTLYRFFESKEDLFLATLLASYEEGLRLVDPARAPGSDPGERLDVYLEGLCQMLGVVGPRMHVHYQAWGVVAGAPAYQERLYGFLRSFHAERDAELEELIRDGQRAGVLRGDIDAVALARSLNSLLSGMLYRASFDPEAARPTALRTSLEVAIRGVRVAGKGEGG
jgi:AcrR family transcriptional regulator